MAEKMSSRDFKKISQSGWLPKHPEKPWLIEGYLNELNTIFKTFQISDSQIAEFKNNSERG